RTRTTPAAAAPRSRKKPADDEAKPAAKSGRGAGKAAKTQSESASGE
ncbi:DUF4167 domain-containing protein, partial [Paracoccus thiocyanatus]